MVAGQIVRAVLVLYLSLLDLHPFLQAHDKDVSLVICYMQFQCNTVIIELLLLQIHLNQSDIKSKHLIICVYSIVVHYYRPVPVRRRPPSTGPRMGETSIHVYVMVTPFPFC